MNPSRRWFQYSLRSFLVVMTAFAVWLGVVVNRAREQREAVEAIEAVGGIAVYDWQLLAAKSELHRSGSRRIPFDWSDRSGTPGGPESIWRTIGDDVLHDVVVVIYIYEDSRDQDFSKETRCLQQLHGLTTIIVDDATPDAMLCDLKAAFPKCNVQRY